MMNKRAISGPPSIVTLILTVVTASFIIMIVAPHLSDLADAFFDSLENGEEQNGETETLSQEEETFKNFVDSYKECKEYTSDNCICGEFDARPIPDGFYIKLENLRLKTRIEIYADNKPTPIVTPVVIENDRFYRYSKQTNDFWPGQPNEVITIAPVEYDAYNRVYTTNNKVQLFRINEEGTSLIKGTYGGNEFDEIKKTYSRCGSSK